MSSERIDSKRWHDSRTWGWYDNFDDAERAIIENHTDIFECAYYDYAVIEEVGPGVCAIGEVRQWYKAEYETTRAANVVVRISNDPVVTKCSEPEFAKGVCNFSIG